MEEKEYKQEYCGTNGQVTVYGARIDITRKGFNAFRLHGMGGTKTIFLRKLTAIQLKEAGKMTDGYIQFIFPGSEEDKGGFFSAKRDENTIMFNKEQEPDFIKLRDNIIKRMDY